MEKKKWYEIVKELAVLFDDIDILDGEVTDELYDRIQSIELAKDDKITQLVWVYGRLIDEHDAAVERIKALSDLKKKKADNLEFVKYILSQLTQGVKWTNGVETVSYRKSTSVAILDEALVPDEYKRTTVEVMKGNIAPILKAGGEVPGAVLDEKKNIQIKLA